MTFRTDVPVSETMVFEHIFEPELWLSEEDKAELLQNSIKAWMFVNDEYAGEIYGTGHALFDEPIPDVDHEDEDYIYGYSIAILPKFQGKGLSKILMAYWMGLVGNKFQVIDFHATSKIAVELMKEFGAVFFKTHQDWFGSGREATYCKIYLS